jgi:transcriptional regulator with XRE-family HTH domain
MESTALLMPEQPVTIGQRLQALMESRDWTLGKLHARSGVSKSQLSLLTRDLIEHPRIDTLEKIATAMDLDVSDLTGASEPTPRLTVYSGVVWVPYVERSVHAGVDAWREASGRTPLSEEEARGHRRLFAGRVTGTCMIPDVMPGATVIWDPDMRHPSDGQMVVVSTNGDLSVKVAYEEAGSYILASNDGQVVRPNGLVLEGVVVKITNNPKRGPRTLSEFLRQAEERRPLWDPEP